MREDILESANMMADIVEIAGYLPPDPPQIYPLRETVTRKIKIRRYSNSPGWKDLKKKRPLPVNPYTAVESLDDVQFKGEIKGFRTQPVLVDNTQPWLGYKDVTFLHFSRSPYFGGWGSMPPDTLIGDLLANAESIAITKLRLKAKDSKFNGAQAFAEAKQVHKMVVETIGVTSAVIGLLSKGRLQAAAQRLGLRVGKREQNRFAGKYRQVKTDADIDRLISNGILRVQYGIRPLLNDIVGASELLAQKQTREQVQPVRAKSALKGVFNQTKVEPSSFCSISNRVDRSASVIVSYGVQYVPTSEVLHTFSQLGLTNPALLAWELLPWSFVIDWLVPVGNALSSLDATQGLQFQSGWKSVSISSDATMTTELLPQNSKNFDSGSGVMTTRIKSYVRVALTEWPAPTMPHFKNPISEEHLLNAAALIAGLRKTVYRNK